jgi:hypothetical protein
LGLAAVDAPAGAAPRFSLSAHPGRPHAGARFTVHVSDRSRVAALDASVCIAAPPETAACQTVRLQRGRGHATFRAPHAGRWTLTLDAAGARAQRELVVRPIGRRLSVIAAGDSLMAPVARQFTRRLRGRARVVHDVHFGTSLSRPYLLDWPAEAQATARRLRPDVVVLLLGASDGLPFGDVRCCGADWSAQYAVRARSMMRAYLQDGAAQVYWLTLPASRDVDRHPALLAVNQGLLLAADGLGPSAHVLDLAGALTPGFVFRGTMRVDGASVRVRADDGLHLTRAGAVVAGHLVLADMRRQAVLAEPSRGR